ncbi:energy-coupling factor ABC transporter ATP-binding protein [Nocardioides sp. JQ2195]|uniref:ABC transporter ATP-binding protein n=1 Tax=Nocardioides sp. JQ2195 TaxID=2592334 RepID=UPI00143E839F|nr:ABC transporter ATP-binding protein [Nocardioides sp. JQ2195]QIX27038.1 energy-coupling factor ABC transporter ATP-binding protein [Nocardioides sp. JQ2195]
MIRFDQVSITYSGAAAPTLSDVDLHVPEGEMVLVMGRTGSGKSTLLRAVNGLVPHFSGGTLRGRVTVDGRDTATHRPRDLADVVGFVGQDPLAGFVTDNVEDELAYGMESLGVSPSTMRKRVEETLDLLGLADLRGRPLAQLSGGQQQRVAIGAVLTTHPKVLVLDEPTSALDPLGAEDVLATLQRLVHDLGMTVVLAEHRLERVVQYVDRIIHVPGNGAHVETGDPATVLATTPIAPPVVQLGRAAGWSPLPLTVRNARRRSVELRAQLADVPPPEHRATSLGAPVGSVKDLVAGYPRRPVINGVTLSVAAGEIVALMGRNGAGKSTLLRTFVGLHRATSGRVEVGEVGLVPQVPADLLYAASVADECATADRDAGATKGATRELLDRLAPGIPGEQHPRDLSEGQKLSLALAIVLVSEPRLVLLDEPTRGLDYVAKQQLITVLHQLADAGHGIVFATHDVELVAEVASRVVVLADGEVVADGAAPDVVVASPAFAPQVAKVMAPQPWLTVHDVAAALASTDHSLAGSAHE